MNNTFEDSLDKIFGNRWFIRTLFTLGILVLLLVYRAIGLEGYYVLIGLTCRNTAYLIIAILLLRQAIKSRRKWITTIGKAGDSPKTPDNRIKGKKAIDTAGDSPKTPDNRIKRQKRVQRKKEEKKNQINKILTYICLTSGTFFLAAFLFLQSNVFLDMLVTPRVALLKECVVNQKIIPYWISGYDTELTGINENNYTKILPLTPALTQRAFDEIDRNKKVRVIFYEHVRRVIIMEKTEDIIWNNIWQ